MSLIYAILLSVAGVTSLVAIRFLWRLRNRPSSRGLMVFMGGAAIWSLTYAAHWLADNPAAQRFWLSATYLGVVTVPVGILIFALTFTDRQKWITGKTVSALIAIPIVSTICIWTDPLHGLFYGALPETAHRVFGNAGPAFWIIVVYNYSLVLTTYGMIVYHGFKTRRIYRRQTVVVIIALSIPLFANIGHFLGFFPLTDIDLTSVLFTLTGVIIIYGVFYLRLIDLVPIAREQVMQSMSEPFFVVDEHDRIVDLNPVAVNLCQTIAQSSATTFIGSAITQFFPQWKEWHKADQNEGEFEPRNTPPHSQIYGWRISQILNSKGKSQGWVLLLNNITRRKLAIQREMELVLEKERVQMLHLFIQNTAHEVRTPLAIISTINYVMPMLEDAVKRKAKSEQVTQQIARITRLLDSALLMAELEKSDLSVGQRIDLRYLISMTAEKFRAQHKRTIEVVFDPSVIGPFVTGTPEYLTEAFRQVMDNACRFSPPDTVITIAAGIRESLCWIEIRDQGHGIPEDALPLIFNTFWRGDKVHTTEGFGIGLSIARKIVELHHGQIEVRSAVGSGTTVRITLPLADENPQTKTPQFAFPV